MALTTDQKSSLLFKKNLGKGSTSVSRDFFEEPKDGRIVVFPTQIWQQADQIPTTAPGGTNGQTIGIVQRWIDLTLTAVAGVANSFYHANLINTIPFNFGDGSYNYALKDSTSTSIPFGTGDWIVDPDAGVLTFYGTTPSNMPPKISFYKYVGTTGFPAVSSGANTLLSNLETTTSVNASLVASSNNAIDLGSSDVGWRAGYINTIVLDSNSQSTTIQGNPAASASVTYTLPAADGTSGQLLSTDGSGSLLWSTVSGGGGGGSLQVSYELGNTITTASGVSVVITGTEALEVTATGGIHTTTMVLTNGSGQLTLSSPSNATAAFVLPSTEGTTGQALITDGSGNLSWGSFDSNTSLNDAYSSGSTITTVGSIGSVIISGSEGLTVSATGGINTAALKLNGSVSGQVILLAPTTPNVTFTLPGSDGTANQYLKTDSSGTLSFGTIDLANEISGVLPIVKGGTNSSSALNNNRMMVSSGGAIVEAGALTNGQLLIGSTGSAPVVATITGTSNQVSVVNAAGSITLSAPQNLDSGASPVFTGLRLSGLTNDSPLRTNASSNIVTGAIDLASSDATGVLPIFRGGTGSSTQNFVELTGSQTVAGVKTFSSFSITPSSAPTTNYQVANKKYVDDQDALQVNKTGDTMTGNLTLTSGAEVLGLPLTPSISSAAASKAYVDAVAQGLSIKAPALATTTSTDLNGITISGISTTATPSNNPIITTISSTTVRISIPSQPFLTGDAIHIDSLEATGGISANDINGKRLITSSSVSWIEVTAGSAATTTASGGGLSGVVHGLLVLTTAGSLSFDGLFFETDIVADDRVLIRTMASGYEQHNGLFDYHGKISNDYYFERSGDADNSPNSEVTGGMFAFIDKGTTFADTGFVLISPHGLVTLGVDAESFSQFSAAGSIDAGDGLQKIGSVVSVKLDGDTLFASGSGLKFNNKLGANLDVNGYTITSHSNGDVAVTPDGTGKTKITHLATVAADAKVVTFDVPTGMASNYTLTLPVNTGSLNQCLQTDGSGVLSWSTVAAGNHNHDTVYLGINAKAADSDKLNGQSASYYALASSVSGKLSNVSEDSTPELGGALDASTNAIYSSTGLKFGDTSSQYQLNKYVHAQTLTSSVSNTVAASFTFAFATYSSCIVEYQIKEATTNDVRVGQIYIATDGTDTSVSDSYSETADIGVEWTGAISGSDCQLKYTTTANTKTMRAMQKLFLA